MKKFPIQRIGSVVTLSDATQNGVNLLEAKNLIPRPLNGFSGSPIMHKLWQLTESGSLYSVLSGVTRPGGGGNLSSSDNGVAVRAYQHGKNALIIFDMSNRKLRGLFYMGDDGTYSGEVSFTVGANDGLPYFEALAVGLNPDNRWYGGLSFGQLMIQNGVDDPIACQLTRSNDKPPGKWRKRGSNAKPQAPVISLINPETSTNVQAYREVAGLKFTANADNFPGFRGNLKIKVQITVSPYAILASTLTGEGVEGDPYIYTLTAPSGTTKDQIRSYVNSDTDAVPIMTASVTVPGEASSWSLDFLSGGSGTGQSTGLSNEIVDVVARYFDIGQDSCGYEGPSSEYSNLVEIPSSSNKDILVRILIDPTAEDGRFSHPGSGIRIYKRYGEADPTYNLVTEDVIPNTYRETNVVGDHAGDRLWCYSTSGAVTMISGDSLMTAAHPLSNGDQIVFPTTVNGFTAFVPYFVCNKSGHHFNLSPNENGIPVITPTTSGSPVCYKIALNQFTENDTVKFTTVPLNLTSGEFFVVNPSTYHFKVSTTRKGSAFALNNTGALAGVAKVFACYFVIGSETEAGDLMSIDQNRPPAHKFVAMAGNINWCAGVLGNPMRVYSSKEQTFDEVCPEGVNLDDYDTIAKSFGASSNDVSGLFSDKQSLHVHFRDGIVIIDPGDTNVQHEPPIEVGMINGGCSTTGRGNKIIFLGEDRNIYEFNGARYGTRAGQSITNNAIEYIRRYVSIDTMEKFPEKCNLLHDKSTQMIFVFMPSDDGIVGFAFDENTQGIYGPFDSPCAPTHVCSLESGRGVYLLGDDDGNIFVWDTGVQLHSSNIFVGQDPIVYKDADDTPGADHAGYIANEVDLNGSAKKLWFSNETIIETSFIDAQSIGGELQKEVMFKGLEWRMVKGSRAHVEVTFTSHDGRQKTVAYGDVGSKEREAPHKVGISMRSSAIKVRMRIVSEGLKRWIVRDMNLLYE